MMEKPEPVALEPDLLNRLIRKGDYALQAKVLRDLLDYPEDDPDLKRVRGKITETSWIAKTLAAHNGDGTWGASVSGPEKDYYRSTVMVLQHLGDLGAPGELKPIRLGVEHLLATAKPVSMLRGRRGKRYTGCDGGVIWKKPLACHQASVLMTLCRYGHTAQPITRAGFAALAHVFHEEEGFACEYIDQSLQPACFMVAPKVLRAYLCIPGQLRMTGDREMIRKLVCLLEKFHLYRYVAAESREWRRYSSTIKPEQRFAEKTRWISEGKTEPRREKRGWLRFSFPFGFNSDLLEVLLALGEAGVERSEIIDEGLAILLSNRQRDGGWKMSGGLNGKMWHDLDRKDEFSPWITYRALLALKRFGLLELKS